MSFFEQILLWTTRNGNSLTFALIWIAITVAAVIYMSRPVGNVAAPRSQRATRHPINLLTWRQAGAPRAAAALTLLATFLASYIAMTLVWEDFAYYDDSLFTLSTLNGHNIQIQIIPAIGRFNPFGLQEFSLLRHFTNTIIGYHVLPIVQLLLFSWFLLILDDDLDITCRTALVILTLLTPSILVSFNGLNFPERDVLFFLASLMLSIKRFEQTQSTTWAVVAVVCAQIMIYCKETAFLFLLGFAASRLILRSRNADHAGRYDRLWVGKSRLDLCFTCLAVLFVVLYFGFIGIPGRVNYAASARLPRADVVLGYTRVDLLAWILVAVALSRMCLILLHRAVPLLFWDGLAFGGVVYFFSYLCLSIFGVYYLAPVDLIAVLYVGRLTVLSWEKIHSWRKAAGILLGSSVLLQDVLVSTFTVFERKNFIHARAEIASVV